MTLTEVNLALSIIGAISVGAISVVVRRSLDRTKRAYIHALVGSTVLVFYGLLGVVTAFGAAFYVGTDLIVWFMIVAFALRISILITLFGWAAWQIDHSCRGRWPKLDRKIDRMLLIGHR